MRQLRRLVEEEILHDQHVDLRERFLGVVQIGLGQERVLADHVHRPDVAGQAAFHHLGDDESGRAGRTDAPRALEPVECRGVVGAVAGQVRRNAAGVAAALHVVLAAERRDAAGRKSELAGDEREIQERVRVVDAVHVLRDPHAPDQARAGERRPRVPARRLRDVGGRHAGDRGGVLQRELAE